jgi:hypothetical protein
MTETKPSGDMADKHQAAVVESVSDREHIQVLEAKVSEAQEALAAARRDLKDAQDALALKEHGVSIGAVVRCRGADFEVTQVGRKWGDSQPSLHGRKITKSGVPSKAEQWISSEWTLVRAAGREQA